MRTLLDHPCFYWILKIAVLAPYWHSISRGYGYKSLIMPEKQCGTPLLGRSFKRKLRYVCSSYHGLTLIFQR